MRKRPEPQLLLSDLPEPRQAARLDDEEKHDKPAEDQVLGGEGEDADEAQGEEILGDRAGFGAGDGGDAEDAARRRADHARGAVVKEPREFVEHPDEEELRRQRGDREIESLDAQAGEAEDDADRRRDEPGEEKDRYDIESGKAGGQLEGGEGAA